jgi:phage protein D/phage baseplate assembly protein gpV
MTAPSPAQRTGIPLTFTVTAGGDEITNGIVSIETWSQANRIPRARIVLIDGEADDGKFPLSEGDSFVPGTKITIAAGYESDSDLIHSGVVVRHAIRVLPGAPAQLVVDTADPLLKMTLARHSLVTPKTTDAAIISALISASGGTPGANQAGTDQTEAFVQAHGSDWDLMLLRAEASGCLVIVNDSKVDIVPPAETSPVLSIGFGDAIINFDATIDATALLGDDAVKSRAWSYADQKVTEAGAGSTSVGVPGNLTAKKLAEVMAVSPFVQQTAAARPEAGLAGWSAAALMRAKLSQLTGTVSFQGSALAKPGTRIMLANLGARFNGDAFVSGVRHLIRDGAWRTTVEIGMTAESFASRDPRIVDPPAAGLAPPLKGLQTGQVKQVNEDPNGDFRVLVTLPMIDGENGIWARLAQPYASKKFGWSFFPEVGDEVVLGFMNEDPASAVIIASVYSNKLPAKYVPNKDNDVKSLSTRSLMEVNFNDKDIILKISTPGGRVVTLDDKTGTVTVEDPNKNKLVMTKSSVDLISTAKLNIKSAADMTIDCGANLTVTAKVNCDVSAVNITGAAKAKLALEGTAQASLKSSAIVEIQGALVKIN